MGKGITLRVTAESLGKLIADLDDTRGLTESAYGWGIKLDAYAVDKDRRRDSEVPEFIVNLDKHQTRYLRNRMTVQAFADEYGEAR